MISEFSAPRQILFGPGAFQHFVQQAKKRSMQYVLIFYSASAFQPEQKEKLKQQLFNANIRAYFFEMPSGEPTLALMRIAVKVFRENGCDGVAAIGGGSTLDLAKAVSAIGMNPELKFEQLASLQTIKRAPFIAVPTTAGSGSEVSRVAVLTDEKLKIKYNPAHDDLIPDVAILDPLLTVNLSPAATAFAAIDALTHAIEAYVSTKANQFSDTYALKAIPLIAHNIEKACCEPQNIEARGELLLGSYYAGLAFSNAATNLAHATGRALGTRWQVPHGQSVALMHPFVVQFSMESARDRYAHIAQAIGLEEAEQLPCYLLQLNEKLQIAQNLDRLVSEEFLQSIAEMTSNALSGTGITTNRVLPSREQIEALYEQLYCYIKEQQTLKV